MVSFSCNKCGFKRQVTEKYAGKTVICPKCNAKIKLPENFPTPPPSKPGRYSLEEFVKKTSRQDKGQSPFELENEHLLEVNLKTRVWTKAGSMISYKGEITFTREGVLEQGMGNLLKKTVSGEGGRLTKAEGRGILYLADNGKRISILNLRNQSIFVNGNDLLAFEDSVKWEIKMIKKIAGMLAGGLFNIKLSGSGMVAITTHHAPLTLPVTPGRPVFTDPNATVAWSQNLEPEIKTDISVKTLLGRGSGESIQMMFQGEGFVVVQPFEEMYFQGG
ncbi:MAG: AIM24 family protein [Proteobacteria bacterium]|nr:AIM24 family protein [Pseudomonadota bacterium]MBU1716166.1 AIM24 family protein [Pseudomonadota bacterium]